MRISRIAFWGAAAFPPLVSGCCAVAAADVAGGSSTTASLPITTTATRGNWEYVGDSDWYRLRLAAGQNYAFRLDEIGDASALMPILFTLRSARRR